MTCTCNCHTTTGQHRPTCSIDTGSSGVPGVPSCSPCDRSAERAGDGCVACGRAVGDAYLCQACTDQLAAALRALRSLLPELETTTTRQDHIEQATDHMHPRPAEPDQPGPTGTILPARLRSHHGQIALAPHAQPANLHTGNLAAEIGNTIGTWVRHLIESRGAKLPKPAPRPFGPLCELQAWRCDHRSCRQIRDHDRPITTIELLVWLHAHLRSIRQDEAAAEILHDFTGAARRAEAAVDRREPEVYVGRCDSVQIGAELVEVVPGKLTVIADAETTCGAQLFARATAKITVCTACGWRYRVAERRAYLLEAARDQWLYPSQIASALTSLGMEINYSSLRTWIARDKATRDAGRPHRWPPILQVATDFDDEDGNPVMEPVLDAAEKPVLVELLDAETGNPVLDDEGEPVMTPMLRQVGRSLYRVGDVIDRLIALAGERQRKTQERVSA